VKWYKYAGQNDLSPFPLTAAASGKLFVYDYLETGKVKVFDTTTGNLTTQFTPSFPLRDSKNLRGSYGIAVNDDGTILYIITMINTGPHNRVAVTVIFSCSLEHPTEDCTFLHIYERNMCWDEGCGGLAFGLSMVNSNTVAVIVTTSSSNVINYYRV